MKKSNNNNSFFEMLSELLNQLISELIIYIIFAILFGLGGGIYLAYSSFGMGALFLILPYVMLIYYAYKKLS